MAGDDDRALAGRARLLQHQQAGAGGVELFRPVLELGAVQISNSVWPMLRPMSRLNLARSPRGMSGKTRNTSRSNRRLAGGNQRMTHPIAAPKARERVSNARQRE
jgi:hypothetical protein